MHFASVWGEAVVKFCRFNQCVMYRSTQVLGFLLPKLRRFQGSENTMMTRYSKMKIEITCFSSLVIAPVTCHFEKHSIDLYNCALQVF